MIVVIVAVVDPNCFLTLGPVERLGAAFFVSVPASPSFAAIHVHIDIPLSGNGNGKHEAAGQRARGRHLEAGPALWLPRGCYGRRQGEEEGLGQRRRRR